MGERWIYAFPKSICTKVDITISTGIRTRRFPSEPITVTLPAHSKWQNSKIKSAWLYHFQDEFQRRDPAFEIQAFIWAWTPAKSTRANNAILSANTPGIIKEYILAHAYMLIGLRLCSLRVSFVTEPIIRLVITRGWQRKQLPPSMKMWFPFNWVVLLCCCFWTCLSKRTY